MSKTGKNIITVYEHQALKLGLHQGFKLEHLEALQRYHGEKGTNYYSLIHKGVKFNQYVGVIQVGSLIVEVLPKTDVKNNSYWREILIGMLHSVGQMKIGLAGSSNLRIRSNSILDLYFELFISELESDKDKGLIKRYRRVEENATALKGKLQFSKQIQHNLIHKERFHVDHQTYDGNHILNQILYAALELTKSLCTTSSFSSRIGAQLLAFPEVDRIKVDESVFSRLKFDRKSETYREAIGIAKMLLLNYHPDVRSGSYHVLALMFDMNVLWERFVLASLKHYIPQDVRVREKVRKTFWKPEVGYSAHIEPDILVRKGDQNFIFDTKWKVLKNNRPADADLKQMYVYTRYYQSSRTALVYPAAGNSSRYGNFFHELGGVIDKPCSIIVIGLPEKPCQIMHWQKEICGILLDSLLN